MLFAKNSPVADTKRYRKYIKNPNAAGVRVLNYPFYITTMSWALNCAFKSSGKLSSVIRTLMSSLRAKV